MKASKLISILLEEVLSGGDGEVLFEYCINDFHSIYEVETRTDINVNGKITKRTFILQNS